MTETIEQMISAPEGRFNGIQRNYPVEDVKKLQGSVKIEYTLARRGAEKLWKLLQTEDYVHTLGAMTGNQAMQQVRAGLKAIYLSGWQVAADSNNASAMYPDQSLYPADSGPALAKRINKTLQRADQIQTMENKGDIDWFAPIVADAEAGFGSVLNAFEIMKAYIEAGAAGVHFEDQLASEKKCGHMGGKVLIPTQQHIANLKAARLAADIMGVPSIILARTDADSAKLLSYNCSPSFNWTANLDKDDIANFQREIGVMGYKYQFVTLAGFHSLNHSMFELARGYRDRGMAAYSELQNA